MTDNFSVRRKALVVGAMTTALFLPLAGAVPALATPTPTITSIAFTDGTPGGTGTFPTYDTGTDVKIVINGASTGTFQYTGCVIVQAWNGSGRTDAFTTTSPTTFTWTAGTNIETLLPGLIDLNPASYTEYNIELFRDEAEITPAGTCSDIWNWVGLHQPRFDAYAGFELVVRQTMTLTGTPKLGEVVTVTAKVPGSLVGNDFDLWACPDRTIYPDDLLEEEENGECYGPIIQGRNGDSTQFVLGYDPERDGTSDEDKAAAEEAWADFCDKHFIVHDYPGGGHSNWIGPIECTSSNTPELAETGAADIANVASIGALAAMLLGGVILYRRQREVNAR